MVSMEPSVCMFVSILGIWWFFNSCAVLQIFESSNRRSHRTKSTNRRRMTDIDGDPDGDVEMTEREQVEGIEYDNRLENQYQATLFQQTDKRTQLEKLRDGYTKNIAKLNKEQLRSWYCCNLHLLLRNVFFPNLPVCFQKVKWVCCKTQCGLWLH